MTRVEDERSEMEQKEVNRVAKWKQNACFNEIFRSNLRGVNYLFSQHKELQIDAGIHHKASKSFILHKETFQLRGSSRSGELRKCVKWEIMRKRENGSCGTRHKGKGFYLLLQ